MVLEPIFLMMGTVGGGSKLSEGLRFGKLECLLHHPPTVRQKESNCLIDSLLGKDI
jgi:hypothetical protein